MKFGWIPDKPDKRDLPYIAPLALPPPKVELKEQCPPVFNQGDLGSCTANAIGAAHQFCRMKQGRGYFMPSRLFLYYNEREIEGTVRIDAGAQIRTGMKCVAKQGICMEVTWPYQIRNFRVKPNNVAYEEALNFQSLNYMRVEQTPDQIKGCLAEGFPIVFGFYTFPSLSMKEVRKTGIIPMPNKREMCIGGHAVVCVGYDDVTRLFTIRNSWGEEWGDNGYGFLPYDYLLNHNLAVDFWTMRLVE